MWVSMGIRGASNSCKLTSSWVTSWSDVARIDTQSAKLQPESTEKSAVEHSNQVTIIEKGWNGEHLLYWSRNGEWSESTCPWVGGMCVWWGWGVKTGRGEKLTRKENWWLCLTHVTAWDLILNMVVQTKPWKSSVTCVLLSHLTPATNQNFTDKVTMIMRLFHSTKFTCHANLQYRSFTSNFRRKFSQLMQIVKTCVAPFTKMHSVGFSEIMPYHVPWVVSYFLEPNVHTCPQNILLYLVTCLAFHYWYPSNCSSCFLDTGVFKSRSRWLDVTAQTWCTSHLVRWSPWKLSTTWKVHPIPNGCIDFLFAKIDVPMAIQAAASWVEVSIRIKTMTLWKSPIGCVVTDVDHVCGEWKRKISPKNIHNSQKQKQLPNTQWVNYVYCPALLTLEVGRARRNHGTNTLWKNVFPKAFAILWKMKGQYSRSLWEGFFSKNCCPPLFTSST